MAGRKQIYLEMRDDIPARFIAEYERQGKAGNRRSLVRECLTVGFAIKELEPRLFRMIQASMESGSLSIDELSVYLDTCQKLGNTRLVDDIIETVTKEVSEPEKPVKKSNASSMMGLMQ